MCGKTDNDKASCVSMIAGILFITAVVILVA